MTKNKTLPHQLIARTSRSSVYEVYQEQAVPIIFVTDELLVFIVCTTEYVYAERQADRKSECARDGLMLKVEWCGAKRGMT